MTCWMTWHFPLIKTFLIPKRNEKPRKKIQKIYFVNLWLKKTPLYEKLNAKNKIRGNVFKDQMSLLIREPKSKSNNAR